MVREGGGGGVTPEGFEASQAFIGVGGDQRSGLGAGLKRPHGFYDSAADDRDVDSHYLEGGSCNTSYVIPYACIVFQWRAPLEPLSKKWHNTKGGCRRDKGNLWFYQWLVEEG